MSVVNVNPNNVVAINQLRLGVQIGHNMIRTFGLNQNYQKWASDFCCKLIRFFDYQVNFNYPTGGPHHICQWNEATQTGVFDWASVDNVVRAIFSVGAEPLIVLGMYWGLDLQSSDPRGYVPPGMSVDPITQIPRPVTWAKYCAAWVQHFKDVGLPVRFYEIVNEIHVETVERANNYMLVVNATVQAMKSINPNVSISQDRICMGGGGEGNPLLDYWLTHNGVDLDSINYHQYNCGTIDPTNPYYYDDPTIFNNTERDWEWQPNALLAKAAQTKWFNARNKKLPIFNTECNLNSAWEGGTDRRQQLMTGAVWLAITLRQEILQEVSYHIYFTLAGSYVYETQHSSKPNDGLGFGFVNSDDGKPYVPYHVYKFIGNNLNLGDTIVESSTNSDSLRVLAWKNRSNLNIMLVNKTHGPMSVQLTGVSGSFSLLKVDESIPSPIPDPNVDRSPITATVDAAQPLQLNGYTVAFLQQPLNNLPLFLLLALGALILWG